MRHDVLLDENYDLSEEGDEWVEGESSDTDVELILLTERGENREFPFLGFGAENRVKTKANPVQFAREMQVQLEADGFEPVIEVGVDIKNFKVSI